MWSMGKVETFLFVSLHFWVGTQDVKHTQGSHTGTPGHL